ncbi:MAG: phenylalanine--tRNA ligase subunit beta [Bacteroidota bacterium]
MKISYNWLKEFISFKESPHSISEILTQTGLEVEGVEKVEKIPGSLEGVVVGEILSCEKHPNADKLKLTLVEIGINEPVSIVCGAPNVAKGQSVLVATVGSTIYPNQGDPIKIKKTKIRGSLSMGMICAEDELGLGTSHEGIMVLKTNVASGTPAIALFEAEEDHTIEIGLTPNRGDAASHLGTARDLKAYFKRDLSLPSTIAFEVHEKDPIQIKVEDLKSCPRYSGITIRGVKVADSPDWLKWKLKVIGLEPINNVVDITNYCLHALGQPMHAFDADEIIGGTVKIKKLAAGTKFVTLDEKEREVHQDDLMICDAENTPLCFAGVFGGIHSGVKSSTRNVFLEVAYFAPDTVRATAQRHGLSTDASFRYERGADPEMTVKALKLATSLILEIAGGRAASEILDHYPNPILPARIKASFKYFHRLIGKQLPNAQILEILNWLEIKTEEVNEETFVAVVPPYRSDVTRPADLVEEVLRIYGFNEIPLDEDSSASYLAAFKKYEPYRVQEELSKFLSGTGFSEILTNSLTNKDYKVKFPLGGEEVEILNPSSEDLTIMKTSPVYTALESIAYNLNRKNTNLKFFEFGRTYKKEQESHKETEWFSCYLCGELTEANWLDEPRKVKLQDLSSTILSMLHFAGVRDVTVIPSEKHTLYDYGMVLKHQGDMLGLIGKLKPGLLNLYGIKQEVFQAQLAWSTVLKKYKSDVKFMSVSKFPEVKRDLSLVLDKHVSYASTISSLAQRQALEFQRRIHVCPGPAIDPFSPQEILRLT